eukprot:GFUD01044874.1.p1 GENE.GFUD01044874.1~~GFUD01044874.1.p1  ORF type:complete len:647 (+),score=101.15 GFUD01044874.1:110-2050(+)
MQSVTTQSRLNVSNLSPLARCGCGTGTGLHSVNVSAASSGQVSGCNQGGVFYDPLKTVGNLPAGSGSLTGSICEDLPTSFLGGSVGYPNSRCSSAGYELLDNNEGPGSVEEEEIKVKLKFFFLNPMDKYLLTRKIPWKLCLQILKAVIVTAQLWAFADYRYAHTSYYTNQAITMDHLFIKDWDQAREIQGAATGKLALYRQSDLYKFVDFAISGWASVEKNSFGPFFRNSSLGFCVEHYRAGNITRDLLFSVDTQLVERCIYLQKEQWTKLNTSQDWLRGENFTVPWQALKRLYLNFSLTSTSLRSFGPDPGPDCFKFMTQITFDNTDHDGQISISLDVKSARIQCSSHTDRIPRSTYSQLIMFHNTLVIILCSSSLILCLRSLLRAELLKYEAELFLERIYGLTLTSSEKLDFLNLWYIAICVNDCLIIAGSAIKLLLELKTTGEDYWDMCSLMLGSGNFLVWFGLLRYLGFFKTYNVLILTMKGAVPNMCRFMVCAAMLYTGFVFAGWSVLGPHHSKFASFMSTSECLFSLINGDDMYATFDLIHFHESPSVWVYSRVYLYTFIGLFIYLVLSLLISIIMDTYEVVKIYYNHGFPQSRLEYFFSSADFDSPSGLCSGKSSLEGLCSIIRRAWKFSYHDDYEELD